MFVQHYTNMTVFSTEYSLGYGTLQGTLQSKKQEISDVNFYRSPSQNDSDIYKGSYDPTHIPAGAYPPSEHARYDGRYVYDHEAPPRPLLPQETGTQLCRSK